MKIFKIAEIVSASFENIIINSNKCSRVSSVLSKCSACLDVCPVEGITVGEKEVEITSCIDCGLCVAKCPTGALTWKSVFSENLLHLIHKFIHQNEKFYLHCAYHKMEDSSVNTIEVPCFGMITSEMWTVLLNTNDQCKIYLPEKACDNCSVTTGENIFQESLAQAKAWLPDSKINWVRTVRKQVEQVEYDHNKRNWLSSILGSAKSTPKEAIHRWASKTDDETIVQSQWISSHRKELKYVARKMPHLFEKMTVQLPVINENCKFCEACSILCPNKALTQVASESILVDPYLCSECNLCYDICFFKGIELKEIDCVSAFEKEKFVAGNKVSSTDC